MAKPKTKLTNIRPREVGLVDVGAVQEDFYVTKKQEGEEVSKEKKVLKKMAVAIHTINFFKSQFTKEEAIAKMIAEGIQGVEDMEVKETDWEYRFIVNPAELFEGASLANYNYISINQGVDSLVGVLKSMIGIDSQVETDVEKAGKKLSKAKLAKLKSAHGIIQELLKELEDGDEITVVKSDDENQTKESDLKTQTNQDEQLDGGVSTDGKPTAVVKSSSETKQADNSSSEEKPAVESSSEDSAVEKRLKAIEDKQEKEVETLKKQNLDLVEENTKLEKRLKKLEDAPEEAKGVVPDVTEEVVEKVQKRLWDGVL